MKKKTHKEYVKELSEKNPNLEVNGIYINSSTSIPHRCKKHNVVWNTTPTCALNGAGCKECRKEKFGESRTKTHQQYIEEVTHINSNIDVIEWYIDARTPILHKCKIDGHEWKASPSNILRGCGCPKCRDIMLRSQRAKTLEQYQKELKLINSNIEVTGDYINSETPTWHICLIDGHEWQSKPANILQGKGCPKCAGNILRTHDEYVELLKIKNPYIEVVESYINARTKILHRCKIDGGMWMIAPSTILSSDVGCPCCNQSKGEREIQICLEQNNIQFIPQKRFDDCKDKYALPFDFYLPSLDICIEYNGEQHYRPIEYFGGEKSFKICQAHDLIKIEYCKSKHIDLLIIKYNEDVKEKLSSYLFI